MTHSFVIITRNRGAETRRLLAALGRQTVPPDEVIVVDASVSTLSRGDVAKDLPFLLTIIPSPAGIAVQRNRGLEEAGGDIVTFMDDDAIPDPEYVASVNRIFLGGMDHATDARDVEDRGVAAAGGTLRNPSPRSRPERMLRDIFLLQTDRGKNRFRSSGIPDFDVTAGASGEAQILPSTALSFRRTAARGLRFDPACFSGAPLGLRTGRCFGEDAWFTAMLSRRGRIVLLAEAGYLHMPSKGNRERTHDTQALYVYALRMLSARFAAPGIARLLRLWALAGHGVLAVLQWIRYRDTGYLGGYVHAMRAPLQRLPRDADITETPPSGGVRG
ncbi:MAG: glycosyltransferase family 2 protein [Bacteroidota bacterium]|nr:glycosyltransferase family 2 protein [Bacteroidota bacterium]